MLDRKHDDKFDVKQIHKIAEKVHKSFALNKLLDEQIRDILKSPENLKENMNNLYISTYSVDSGESLKKKLEDLVEISPYATKNDPKYSKFYDDLKEIADKPVPERTSLLRDAAFKLATAAEGFLGEKRKLTGLDRKKVDTAINTLAILVEEAPGISNVVDGIIEKTNKLYGYKKTSKNYIRLDNYGGKKVEALAAEKRDSWVNFEITEEFLEEHEKAVQERSDFEAKQAVKNAKNKEKYEKEVNRQIKEVNRKIKNVTESIDKTTKDIDKKRAGNSFNL